MSAGSGWNLSTHVFNCFSKTDEWQVYNSMAPIGATVNTSSEGISYVATVAIQMQ